MEKVKRIIGIFFIIGVIFFNQSMISAQDIAGTGSDIESDYTGLTPINIAYMKTSDSPYALIVDKTEQLLYLYTIDGEPKRIEAFHCSTGRNNGNKRESGDLRTPEGIYYFSEIKEDGELLPKYGVRAFVLNYPNRFDKIENRDGFGIWLHATNEPDRVNLPYDSKGCIIVTNDDILQLSEYIYIDRTPIIVEDKVSYISSDKVSETNSEIETFIKQWIECWQGMDIDNYISHYSRSFYSQKMNWRRWKRYKERLFDKYSRIKVGIDNLSIIKRDNMAVVNFFQKFSSDQYSDKGTKRLYVIKKQDKFEIIGETWNEGKPFFVNKNQQKVTLDGR